MSLARRLELLAWAERTRRLDHRGRLRRRVPLQRRAAGAVGGAGSQWAGALRRHLRQSRVPGVAPGLSGVAAGPGGRIFPAPRGGHAPLGSQHPGGHGRVHGGGAFPAAHPPHAPRGVEPAQRLVGRLAAAGCRGLASLPSVAAGLHLTVRVDSLAREQQLLEQARAVDVEINGLSSYWLAQLQPAGGSTRRPGAGVCRGARAGNRPGAGALASGLADRLRSRSAGQKIVSSPSGRLISLR